jgi:hypothetical protein
MRYYLSEPTVTQFNESLFAAAGSAIVSKVFGALH